MTWFPFLCLGFGLLLGNLPVGTKWVSILDRVTSISLVLLMITIGLLIGTNEIVMESLPKIGWQCAIISLFAILFSVLFVIFTEKTLLPLEQFSQELKDANLNVHTESKLEEPEPKKPTSLLFSMPVGILVGVLVGSLALGNQKTEFLQPVLIASLVILYIGVGVSIASNRSIFAYIKKLGYRISYLSIAILLGSLLGGVVAGFILPLPMSVSLLSAGGMSYYSLTGAFMTNMYGIEQGIYGFVVNVMREFFTVLLIPLLVKASKGSPIAGGAAGSMDTMLMPITKFVGPELGLVALITGIFLTLFVPFLLPFLANIL